MAEAQKPILVVAEDEPFFAEMLKEFLAMEGFDARVHANGPDALQALKELRKPAALLTDFGLETKPDESSMNGIELIHAARRRLPELPVIMISGGRSDEVIEEVESLGGKFLSKPVDLQEVVDTLKALGAGQDKGPRRPMDHAIRPPDEPHRG